MKKRNEPISPVRARQIELLKKYYEVDEEKRTVKVKLSYEKASELLTDDYSSETHPEFNSGILIRTSEVISRIPLGYKIDLQFAVDDYEGHNAKTLLESFNDAVEMRHYSVLGEGKRNGLRIALLLVAGIVSLVFMIAGASAGWFGSDTTKDLITEVIDIIGWVFIWEAVSIMFLSPSEERMQSIKLRTRVNSIAFIDGESEKLLSEEKCENVFNQWAEESNIKKLSKEMLLVAGSGFLAIAISSLISNIAEITQLGSQYSPLFICLYALFLTMSFIVMCIAGIGAISTYIGHGPFKKFVGFFGAINLVLSITSIVLSFVDSAGTTNWKLLVSGIFSLVFYLLYATGWLLSFKKE